jgi:hypothetical protein
MSWEIRTSLGRHERLGVGSGWLWEIGRGDEIARVREAHSS